MSQPRVVLLRGHNVNVWDLRPLERLGGEYDVSVLMTGSNVHRVEGLGLPIVPVRTPRDALPPGRASGAAAYALGERYLGLRELLTGADVVHSAEIGTWFSAQAAKLRDALGFKLVLTVWETLPWRDTYRWPRERGYRRAVMPRIDLCLAATERARDALLLEGVPADRIEVAPPGIDLERFAAAGGERAAGAPLFLSAGRLVWEKGHQDFLRALAAMRQGIGVAPDPAARGLIVGDGPEAGRLRSYAEELGIADAVQFRATVPYDEMPALYAGATALVLASLPTKGWEEQFGMVLVEAQAAGTPVIACASGAIPEVLAGSGTLVEPGDWRGLARALADTPRAPSAAGLERFSVEAAAQRTAAAYARVLGR
jgi:glycosyltransferase involved in cell wall biosynthesis